MGSTLPVMCYFSAKYERCRLTFFLRSSTQVQARVLYVELSTRLVALSLRSYLVQAGSIVDPSPAAGDRIGEVVKDCKMTAMHHMSGAMLELPDKTMAFVHVS